MARHPDWRITQRPLTDPLQWEQEMGDEVAALKLVQSIEVNTRHYVEILARAVDECMPEPSSDPTYAVLKPRRRRLSHTADVETDLKTTFWMS